MQLKVMFGFVSILLVSACAAAAPPATRISVEATDFAYNPISITIPVDQPITLELKNSGNAEHDFVIENIRVKDVESTDSGTAAHHQMDHESDYDLHFFAKAGETATLQFTALESGTYEIFCSVEGHKEAGMIGELIVAASE